jgi:CheY-like chemotaxis protein
VQPRKRVILCVEDEDLQLKSRRMLFESAGFQVVEAQSAAEAVSVFRSVRVDAVVMDYWLSGQGGNGTAAAEEMKRINSDIPIVMFSTFTSLPGETSVVDLWMRKGATEPEVLVREVERLIDLRFPASRDDKPA